MKKAYFQYYETFETVVQKFKTPEQREHFRSVIINYGFYGTEPDDLNDIEDMAWIVIKELIDQQLNRRKTPKQPQPKPEEQPKAESQPIEDQPTTETQNENTEQEAPKTQAKPQAKRFEKPTLEEVKAYIKEKGYHVNGDQFFNYYESNGWRIGRNPMKNWQSTVQSWNARDRNKTGTMWQNGSADTGTETYENYF